MSTRFGILDEVCNLIAAAAQWQYHDTCAVEMTGFEYAGRRYQRVHMIEDKNHNWRLWYARGEGELWLPNQKGLATNTGVVDPTNILKITIPYMELTLAPDPNNIHLHLLVEGDWESQKIMFLDTLKTHATRLPLQYLFYRASNSSNYIHQVLEEMPAFLTHSTEDGLQYDLRMGDEPSFPFQPILQMFAGYLITEVYPLFNIS